MALWFPGRSPAPGDILCQGLGDILGIAGFLRDKDEVISGTPEPDNSYDTLFALLQAAAGEVPEAAQDAVKSLDWLAMVPAELRPSGKTGSLHHRPGAHPGGTTGPGRRRAAGTGRMAGPHASSMARSRARAR